MSADIPDYVSDEKPSRQAFAQNFLQTGEVLLPLNGTLFTIKEVDGPLTRGDKDFPVRVCYAAREILLLRTLPESVKPYVLAAAVSEAAMKHRIPLVWPKWEQGSR